MDRGQPLRFADFSEVTDERASSIAEAVIARVGGATSERRTARCRRDVAVTLTMIERPPEVFAEYCAWMAVFLQGIGVPSGELVACLEVMKDHVDADAQLDAGLARLGAAPGVLPDVFTIAPAPAELCAASSASEGIRVGMEHLKGLSVAMAYARWPESSLAHGEKKFRCLEDAEFTLKQLQAGLDSRDTSMFVAYAEWFQVLLTKLGLDERELHNQLLAMRDAVSIAMAPAVAEPAVETIQLAIDRLEGEPIELPSFFVDGAPHVDLARAYLGALIEGDRRAASRMITDAVENGITAREIYTHVFQTSQYEVGRLWQTSQISVAQEHFCTAATQMIMGQLYPYIFTDEQKDLVAVATCVGGNLHEVGVRFVADFFEMAGWQTFYLGANTPTDHVVRELVNRRAHVLAISATLSEHLPGVRDLVDAVRAHSDTAGVKILVGGHPFRTVPNLWKQFGADGSAVDAGEAVTLAESLCA